MDDGYDQDLRGPALRPDPLAGRPGTGCSRSATSSATATGSTACGRATACSSPRSLLEQVGGFDESFDDAGRRLRQPRALRAARARRPTSPCARSSARARSTRCTAAPPPTSPTPPSAGHGCSATASTTPSCGAGRSRAPASRSTTSGGIPNPAARRTKPRRLSAERLRRGVGRRDPTASPTGPTPVPDDLRWAFTEAVWRSLPWQRDDLARPAGGQPRPPTCSPTRR